MPPQDTIELAPSIDLPEFEDDHTEVRWITVTDEPEINTYRITDGGALYRSDPTYEAVPPGERPHPDAESGSVEAMVGAFEEAETEWEQLDYDGVVNFHATVAGEWYGYEATFSDGELEHIERVDEDAYELMEDSENR